MHSVSIEALRGADITRSYHTKGHPLETAGRAGMFRPVFRGGRSSVGRALDCGSSCRGFNPRRSPHDFSGNCLNTGAPSRRFQDLSKNWTPIVEQFDGSLPRCGRQMHVPKCCAQASLPSLCCPIRPQRKVRARGRSAVRRMRFCPPSSLLSPISASVWLRAVGPRGSAQGTRSRGLRIQPVRHSDSRHDRTPERTKTPWAPWRLETSDP